MTKAAIYARYSSDLQTDASIEDQIRVCKAIAEQEGYEVINCYTDHGISGASMMLRPGIQQLVQDGLSGKFDIVLAEAMDRLSRDQEDIAAIYKRMQFAGAKIFTKSEGLISELHIGLKGTMNSMFLKDLADKTRRGLHGRIEKGKSGGGVTYGYDIANYLGPDGELVRGERKINEVQAMTVRRIFNEFATGKSPKAIAKQLNAEGVPGPHGKTWGPSTIYGNRQRGTGILNNELYIGVLVWNRQRYIKNPDTGKRVARLNPEAEWIRKDVPELRLLDQELWQRVKDIQGDIKKQNKQFWEHQRPRYLFSHLLKCGKCGGGMAKMNKTRYGCSRHNNKGTCDNKETIRKDDMEKAVLHALQKHLLDPKLCEVFCDEYARYMNELRIRHNTQRNAYEAELKKRQKQDAKFVDAIANGAFSDKLKEQVNANTARIHELQDILSGTNDMPVLLHPKMGRFYQNEVKRLIKLLNDPKQHHEAADQIRTLIEKVVLTPREEGGLSVDLHGDLAGILGMARNGGKPLDEKDDLVQQVYFLTHSIRFIPET